MHVLAWIEFGFTFHLAKQIVYMIDIFFVCESDGWSPALLTNHGRPSSTPSMFISFDSLAFLAWFPQYWKLSIYSPLDLETKLLRITIIIIIIIIMECTLRTMISRQTPPSPSTWLPTQRYNTNITPSPMISMLRPAMIPGNNRPGTVSFPHCSV